MELKRNLKGARYKMKTSACMSLGYKKISCKLRDLLKEELGMDDITFVLAMDAEGDLKVVSHDQVEIAEENELRPETLKRIHVQKATSMMVLSGRNSPLCGHVSSSGGWGFVFRCR